MFAGNFANVTLALEFSVKYLKCVAAAEVAHYKTQTDSIL